MCKYFTLMILLVIASCQSGQAQVFEPPKDNENYKRMHSIISVDAVQMLNFYNISYIHSYSAYHAIGWSLYKPTGSGITGYGIGAELRLTPNGKYLKGLYIAPVGTVLSLGKEVKNEEGGTGQASSDILALGLVGGWQWSPIRYLTVGGGLGLNYFLTAEEENNVPEFKDYKGLAPIFRLEAGLTW